MNVRTRSLKWLVLPLLWAVACGDDEPSATSSGSTQTPTTAADPSTSTSTSTTTEATTSATTAPNTTNPFGSSSGGNDDNSNGAECSIYEQDCPSVEEKCVPWSDQPDLVPDDIRCCPIVGGEPGLEPGDTCSVDGYLGSCLDDCSAGTFCLDIDGDGEGTCQRMCEGSESNPECRPGETCFVYFAGVPLCFPDCDPLVQNCPESQGCYPDEAEGGGTGFICLPTIGSTGDYNEYCWLLSNCLPGFICVSPDFLPDCNGIVGCCTPLCDVDEPDTCDQFHSDIECVSWYFGGQMPPSAALENVGACAVPP